MKIIYSNRFIYEFRAITDRFIYEFRAITDFIALDGKIRAKEFSKSIKFSCQNLINMPYKCRKSIYFNDENVRDLIYKGYVIPYLVENECINILGIYKENTWEFDT